MEDNNNRIPVEVRDLRKSFGEQKVLNGISLSVSQGQTVAILGRSGTGKSVLLKLLVGLQPPDSGSVRIAGQEITGIDHAPVERNQKKDRLPVSAGCFVRFADGRAERRLPAEPARRSLRIRAQKQSTRIALQRRYERGGFREDAFRDFRRNAEARGTRARAGSGSRRFSCSTSRLPDSTRSRPRRSAT